VPGFPDVEIVVERLRQAWETHDGRRDPNCNRHRMRFPVIVTNREESRRVALSFDVTINRPDGNGVLMPGLPTEQQDQLPLVVDAQDLRRLDLSLFLNEYVTGQLRTVTMFQGQPRYDINGDLFRLNVFDRLSRRGIDMWLPGVYPRELPPAASD